MAQSEKYGRTWHYPFSPGTTSDDRIYHDYWQDIQKIPVLIHTEKLDGENNCLSRYGVFARSHAAPTTSPWTAEIRQYWHTIKNELGDLEIFLENLYAIHSIEYHKLPQHYHVFAVRENGIWLSWEETKFYAAMIDLPVVPEIILPTGVVKAEKEFEKQLIEAAAAPGTYAPVDIITQKETSMEGIVSRNAGTYSTEDFKKNVFKYVRKGHVKTDAHWTRNWKRARLLQEGGNYVED